MLGAGSGKEGERGQNDNKGMGVEGEREEVWKSWKRQVVVSACYAPMTVHYSLERGLMSEKWVSLCGLAASVVSLREAWRSTPKEGDQSD